AVRAAFDAIASVLPGGSLTLWTIIGAAIVALAAVAAAQLATRRARAIEHEAQRRRAAGDEAREPRALEREAERAERSGDYERAVRLRFRAGLLRLDIEPSTTSGAAARRLRSAAFDALADRFDAIV